MIQKSFFQKHHKRLVLEAVLKAVICGLLVGFLANFLAALASWIFDFGGIWFAIVIGVAVGVITGVSLYFAKFRPSMQELAHRVDRLGLEERMVTMLEMQQDESYIAKIQREDAQKHLKDVEERNLRMRLPKLVSILAAIAMVLGCGMTTVAGLAAEDIIQSGAEVLTPEELLPEPLAISYIVEGDGVIEGETDQLIQPGEDATPVVAVPEDGWVFVGWDDGLKTTERHDKKNETGALYVAIFQQINDSEGGEAGNQEGQEGGNQSGEGDKADDLPPGGESDSNSEQGGPGDKGSGSGADSNNEGGQGEGEEQGEGKGNGKGQGAGGKWDDANQFLDGSTYYGDHKEEYYAMAQQIFEENGEIPPEMREFFENYFSGI